MYWVHLSTYLYYLSMYSNIGVMNRLLQEIAWDVSLGREPSKAKQARVC